MNLLRLTFKVEWKRSILVTFWLKFSNLIALLALTSLWSSMLVMTEERAVSKNNSTRCQPI